MQQTLKFRSDRVIALFRLALAVLLIGTSWIDPDYPTHASTIAMGLLWVYLVYAAGAVVVAWSDWWLAHRMRLTAFLVDLSVTFLLLYLIEGSGTGLASPFLGFFIFLVVSAVLIWPARRALAVLAALLLTYCAVGLLLFHDEDLADPAWYLRRLAFMTLLTGLIVWFGHSRNHPQPARLEWPFDAPLTDRFEAIVAFIRDHMRASGVAVFWSPDDEPWLFVGVNGIAGRANNRLGPDELDLGLRPDGAAILFDRVRHRRLVLTADGRIIAQRGAVVIAAADYLDAGSGILVPIASETGTGVIVLTGIKGVAADHLAPARALTREIAHAIDRHILAETSQSAQIARLRLSMARDLHDSVAQSLAGASFRVEALGQAYRAGEDIGSGLDALHQALGSEQQNVQGMIYRLRSGEAPGPDSDLNEAMQLIIRDAERRWGIRCTVDCGPASAKVPTLLIRQIERLVNEGVANAVRHGGARQVSIVVRRHPTRLALVIANRQQNAATTPFVPLSIAERVDDLGGSLDISADGGQTVLTIEFPVDSPS